MMAVPVSKRRKLEDTSSDEDGDDASFASFGSLSDESGGNAQLDIDEGQDADSGSLHEDSDAVEDAGENHDVSDSSPYESGRSRHEQPNATTEQTKEKHERNIVKPRRRVEPRHAGSRSSTVSVQIDELLSKIRPKHGKMQKAAEEALHNIKSTIENIPARKPASVVEAEHNLTSDSKGQIFVPFPNPRPSKDAKYKLEYARPSNINVVGSYALKTYRHRHYPVEIDTTVTMPFTIFQEKDYLNFRYFYKRAYYLACIAASLRETHEELRIQFQHLHGDTLKPVIVISTQQNEDSAGAQEEQKPNWRINIIPCIHPDVFSHEKLRPDKNCIRATSEINGNSADHKLTPTPFYNSSLRADMLMTSYLKALHQASKKCAEWKDACLLARTWLHQRGFSSVMHEGGFGDFEFSALMALLLDGEGQPVLGEQWSSYQLFRGTLQFLATRDASVSTIALGTDQNAAAIPKAAGQNGTPILWDSARAHNLFYKMTLWSYRLLRYEARATLSMLADQHFDRAFDATFTVRNDQLLLRYDYVLQYGPSPVTHSKSQQPHAVAFEEYQRLYSVLQRGLGDRVSLITIIPQSPGACELAAPGSQIKSNRQIRIGFVVNSATVDRTVDHGPTAEDKVEAASFRKFWGEKAELRRFKDGSILECVVWDAKGTRSVFEQIVRFLVAKVSGQEAEQDVSIIGDGFKKLLPHVSRLDAFQQIMDAYTQFEVDIRGLENLPLSVRQIMPCDAQLRYASIALPGSAKQQVPCDVTIQFEGSTRWPDDIVAVQRTKIAFLLNISERLQDSADAVTSRIGLENQEHDILNQAFLDIISESGASFRLRIHHEREQALLERRLKDRALDHHSKEVIALGLAKYKRDYVKGPAFTQAIALLCRRHLALSGAIRLTKRWFASHLLSNHIADEVVEMLVAQAFVRSWPWQAPSSVQTGFLRTLWWISRWNWRVDPLIVDLSGTGDLKHAEVHSIKTKFEAWRSLDPALNRVVLFCGSNVDPDGIAWTDGRTPKVVAARMTSLAKAACIETEKHGLVLNPSSLFSSALSEFDFVIHFDPDLASNKPRRKRTRTNGTTFKNLEIDLPEDGTAIEHRSVDEFRNELADIYGSSVLFFSGGAERPVIAGLWNPQTESRAWKLNLAYSTTPVVSSDQDKVQANLNKEAMLAETARLGGDMVRKIELNRSS